jgi:2-polyprenyl-6-methoxyphenol hydroxylase-like FAD-dependent oxidoreductase
VPEEVVPAAMLEHGLEFAVHDGGHCVFYQVPDPGRPGKILLNWGWYLQVPEGELPGLLTDRDGQGHTTSVARGRATDAHRRTIHRLARERLRGVAAEAIGATPDPFIQAVYEVDIPSYHRGHVCLLGDANALARGHGGGGAIKATQQAIALATTLATHTALDDALVAWNAAVQPAGSYLVNLGRVLGHATVTDTRPGTPWTRSQWNAGGRRPRGTSVCTTLTTPWAPELSGRDTDEPLCKGPGRCGRG